MSAEEAFQLSKTLISEETHQIIDKKVCIALQKFIMVKVEQSANMTKMEIKNFLDYVKNVCDEYADYRKQEDDLVLFGGELELQDIRRCAE